MRSFLLLSALLLGAAAVPTSTSSNPEFEILKYRNWDLRFSQPGCSPNRTGLSISLLHRSGVGTRDCVSLLTEVGPHGTTIDLSEVDSLSWKAKRENGKHDLCLYASDDCSDKEAMALRNGWEVCLKYEGWQGYRVVEKGDSC
ncbi:hypothetical protein P170DRAFT_436930 [Aspergillus steynii IBT 23096]|uniref:Uncharacterized protein n=1 Tax=Aspergillus steynii IBT 23096 TaxID=1392250 RepID=A0A2I2G8Z5_9EURO|nr:uncharacterized protein P170DRAFT_436930 [Aspergillus steynii IBT 23096]PLB49349.1 hypothetical protein P170DRAFT_436930 [Aspergillus steynii IBT 23096]